VTQSPAFNSMIRSRQILHLVFPALLGAWVGQAGAAPIPHSLSSVFQSPSIARQTDTKLGSSVAMDGGVLVVGSPHDDIGGEDSGVVWMHDVASGQLLQRIDNPNPLPESHFGWSVALSGNRLVVGAPDDNTGASDAGIVHVYDLASATPTVPVLTLPNPNPAVNDGFGYSVAISGTDIVVGTPDGDSGVADAGCVYVYDLASPTPAIPVRQINHPNPSGQNFGFSVSLSGSRIVVGACQDGVGADLSRAYIFDLDSGTPAVPVLMLDDGTPATNEQFGFAVAIAADRVVVSAPRDDTMGNDSGRAYAYDLSSPTPGVPTAILKDSTPAADDLFGMSLSLTGDIAAVGAHLDDDGASNSGSVYCFNLSSGTPDVAVVSIDNPGPSTNDEFGRAVAFSGTRLLVGASGDNTVASSAGSAYVFEVLSGTPAVPIATINNPSPSSDEEFGGAVAVSGSLVVVGSSRDDKGASNSGSVAVYNLDAVDPEIPAVLIDNPAPTINDYFGGAVAASGTLIAVAAKQDDTGAANSGTVYVYDTSLPVPGVPLRVIPNPAPQSQDEFGSALAISGTLLAVGVPRNNTGGDDAGSVYVFDLASQTPGVPVHVIDNPGPAIGDWFGYAVAISGNRLVVGAPRDDANATNAGSAYIYDISSPTPTVPVTVIANPAPALNDEFGYSVAVSGPNLAVGSWLDDTVGVDAGGVSIYDLSTAQPSTPVASLTWQNPGSEDFFGSSLAISGTRVLVGAPGSDLSGDEGGAAYVFELSSATSTVPADLLETGETRAFDALGTAVAIDGTNVIVGAPLHDGTTHDRGAAYWFDPDPPSPEMQVEQPPGVGLLDGAASIHFGNAPVGSAGSTQSVIVRNIGTSVLQVQNISITGGDSGDFDMVSPLLPVSLEVDASVLIEVTFAPGSAGSRVSTLRIDSNAGEGSPFDIALTGQGLSAADDTDGDGLNDVVELGMESLGFDWQVNDEELVAMLQWGANAEGLFSGPQLQAMNPNTPLISKNPVTGDFKVTVAVKKSVDLMNFSIFPLSTPGASINSLGALEVRFSAAEPKAFFRLEPR
jgi:FG-GAP repeat